MGNRNGSVVPKLLGLVIVAFVAIFVFKLVLSAIGAVVSLAFTLVMVLLLGYVVVWLLRKL